MARAVEGLTVDETARLLSIKPETVKTRLHRARSYDQPYYNLEIRELSLRARRTWRLQRASPLRMDKSEITTAIWRSRRNLTSR